MHLYALFLAQQCKMFQRDPRVPTYTLNLITYFYSILYSLRALSHEIAFNILDFMLFGIESCLGMSWVESKIDLANLSR